MGGTVDRILLVPLVREGHEDEDADMISQAFETFDANKCECFNPDDKERMLNIINTAFGDMDRFNDEVRAIFEEAGFSMGYHTSSGSDEYGTHMELSTTGASSSSDIE